MLSAAGDIIILFDVDNTLLDNDTFGAELSHRLEGAFGKDECERYWRIFHDSRSQLGVADYLGSLQLFRAGHEHDPQLLHLSEFMLEYPFADRVYPQALAAVEHLASFGATAVLSDGDVVFQPRKIRRSGIWYAVGGRVMVCLHKEQSLDVMQQRYPASRYLMIDDKPGLLAAMKRRMGARLTTFFVRQGHYAHEPDALSHDPPPDRIVERIGDLTSLTSAEL